MNAVKPKSTNVVWHQGSVPRQEREARNGHRGATVWLTGLSGAGKSTLAHGLEQRLFHRGCQVVVIDGDNVRHGLCGNLGFTREDREENIRRVGELSKLFVEAGMIVVTAFISPFVADRTRVRDLLAPGDFYEVHIACPLSVCEERDVKGMYKRARAGEIKDFTGISSPYEPPPSPELSLDTATASIDACLDDLESMLRKAGVLHD